MAHVASCWLRTPIVEHDCRSLILEMLASDYATRRLCAALTSRRRASPAVAEAEGAAAVADVEYQPPLLYTNSHKLSQPT